MRSLILTVVLAVAALTAFEGRKGFFGRQERNLDLLDAEQQQQLVQVRAEQLRNTQEPAPAVSPEWK